MMLDARCVAGLSREAAALELNIGMRTLQHYEAGETCPPADVVLAASRLYGCPELTSWFCDEKCAIGGALGCRQAGAVRLPEAVLGIIGTLGEAQDVMGILIEIARDGQVTPDEREKFKGVLEKLLAMSMSIEAVLHAGHEMEPLEEVVQKMRKSRAATQLNRKDGVINKQLNFSTKSGKSARQRVA